MLSENLLLQIDVCQKKIRNNKISFQLYMLVCVNETCKQYLGIVQTTNIKSTINGETQPNPSSYKEQNISAMVVVVDVWILCLWVSNLNSSFFTFFFEWAAAVCCIVLFYWVFVCCFNFFHYLYNKYVYSSYIELCLFFVFFSDKLIK